MSCRTVCALVAFFLSTGVPAAEAPCPIKGELVHWIADYCMARIGTDDEIAASRCIGEQLKMAHKNTCEGKQHYKRALCAAAISNGAFRDPLERCVADPHFSGATVRNGGVGR